MNRRTLLLLWLALASLGYALPGWIPEPASADLPDQSPRTIEYEIEATLDPVLHKVQGKGKLTWRNDSPVPVTEIQLHLYLNAFKDRFSAFMRESSGSHRGHKFNARAPGGIDITSFRLSDGTELKDAIEFLTTDGETPLALNDTTVAKIPLPSGKSIPPNGQTSTFEIEWTSHLPQVFARTGHGGDFHMIAQWYPKPGVWEQGTDDVWCWNCHQFHGSSEFYSDYGTYRVRMTVPDGFRLGASGKRQKLSDREDEGLLGEDGSVTYAHVAEDVHDFAWVCSKDFLVVKVTFPGGSGVSPEEHKYVAGVLKRPEDDIALDEVEVTFLLQPEHEDQFERHKKAVFTALTYLGFWFGKYPYSTLTVVDPDHRGRDAGGMEYPTLITGGTRIVRPERQLSPEGVLVHEFAHQHFYGLVGTNEFENAWMDEGMTTYATAKALMRAYPPQEEVTWFGGGLFHYGERPFDFTGLAAESRRAMPLLSGLFDEHLKMPFGEFGPIEKFARKLDVNHPPKQISLWAGYGDVGPIGFLRELPFLTHLRPRPSTSKERERGWVASQDMVDPIVGRKAWEYMDRRSYGVNSYGRPSSSLRTLEGYVGEETMIRIMRTYAARYRFKHPTPDEFFATASEVAEADGKGKLDWFFEDVFRSATPFDFGIHAIDTQKAPKPEGHEGDWHESIVTVRRYGGVRMPCEVQVAFGDREIVRKLRWELDDTITVLDGGEPVEVLTPPRGSQSRWVKLYFQGAEKVTVAEVDPHGRFGLDKDRTNDGRRTGHGSNTSWTVALKALAWVQMNTTFYGGL